MKHFIISFEPIYADSLRTEYRKPNSYVSQRWHIRICLGKVFTINSSIGSVVSALVSLLTSLGARVNSVKAACALICFNICFFSLKAQIPEIKNYVPSANVMEMERYGETP